MSAFIVSNEHIASLVNFAVVNDVIPVQKAQVTATLLLDANVTSVNTRYNESTTATIDYNATPKKLLTPIQAIKAAQCLEYQSCEYEGFEISTAKKIIEAIISNAIRGIDGYDTAKWSI